MLWGWTGWEGQLTRSAQVDWAKELASHDRWLRTAVFARLRNREDVDEVMQEVALAVMRQSAPLVDSTKVAPWLYRIAIRATLMYRRRLGRQRGLNERYGNLQQPSECSRADDPLDWLLATERRDLVRQALLELASRDAEILLLKYTESWSYAQLSSHLGISRSAVEARLHRARGRLRSRLVATGITQASS